MCDGYRPQQVASAVLPEGSDVIFVCSGQVWQNRLRRKMAKLSAPALFPPPLYIIKINVYGSGVTYTFIFIIYRENYVL